MSCQSSSVTISTTFWTLFNCKSCLHPGLSSHIVRAGMLIIRISHVPRSEGGMPHGGIIVDVPVNVRQGIVNVLHAFKAIALATGTKMPPHAAGKTGKDIAGAPAICNAPNTVATTTRSTDKMQLKGGQHWQRCCLSSSILQDHHKGPVSTACSGNGL